MAEESGAEKTEDPTARKLRNARDEGQVARSIELPAAAVTIGAILVMVMMGGFLINHIAEIFASGFKFDRKTLDNPDLMVTTFAHHLGESFLLIVPILMVTVVLAILSSGATGGYLFSLKSILPNFGKLSPLAGFKRMFGTHAAVELLKAILKFTLVTMVLWALVSRQMDAMMQLGQMALEPALAAAGWMIAESALWLSLSLMIIALIDAPYQKYSYIKRMRMTKQEVKDEMKDMEGRPEVKQQIRRRQREMANNKMIAKGQRRRCGHYQPRALCCGAFLRPYRRWRPHLVGQRLRPHGCAHSRRSPQARCRNVCSTAFGTCALFQHRGRLSCA
jgi:flagellar biosynthesis protein FlhB